MFAWSRGKCRWFNHGAILVFLIFIAQLLSAAPIAETTEPTSTPERLLEEARQAAEKGDAARQFALLRKAVGIAPDFELARWQLGQMKVGDEWVAIEDSQRAAANDPKQDEYRRLRSEHGESVAGQLALARWCRKNGLDEEARFHWSSVLAAEPNHREALRALEMRWQDGKLVTRAEIDAARKEQSDSRDTGRQWKSRVTNWQRILSRGREGTAETTAVDEIRAIADLGAIEAMEAVTLADDAQSAPAALGRERMGLAFVSALKSLNEQAATESLVRHAVLAPSGPVRTAATASLGKRPLWDFVPILLDGLAMPIESSFRVVTSNDGSVHYLHSIFREGSHNEWKHQTSRAAFLRATDRQIAARLAGDVSQGTLAANARDAGRGTATAFTFANQFGREALAAEEQVAAMNRTAAALNERILMVLTEVTGQDFGNAPREWWDWWSDENGYYLADRPVYETNDATYAQYTPPAVPTGGCECFAAGTLVWTKSGQQPIDKLEIGELVLAQDVNTGELAYKPVIARTVRPPSPLVKFTIGREKLISTQGHPMWVTGVGWRMAKELGDGAVLHGVTGPLRVESIAHSDEAEAYNLVVADFNTYFVGESGILVHDNTPRRPTQARVPGLPAK